MAPLVEIPKANLSPQEFFDSVDWEAWYHEYATETIRGGLPKYTSTFAFAKDKGKGRQQRDLILHVIGPVIPGKSPMYRDIPQWDWERRRKDGFWLGPEVLKKQLDDITSHADAVDELRASAQAHLLPLIAKISSMTEKIEATFSGQLFMPGLSDKANEARANLYARLTEQTVRLAIQLQEAYARSLCVNINDLAGTIMMRDSVASKTQSKDATADRSFLGRIIELTVEKAEALKMPLPDADIGAIAREQIRA